MRRDSVASLILAYLAMAVALSLFLGVVRSCLRFSAGILPNQYLAHSAVINALLFSIFAVACIPLVAAIAVILHRWRAPWKAHLPTISLFFGFGLSFVLYWGFNTSIGFRVLREFLEGKKGPVFAELSLWIPGMFAFVGGAMALTMKTKTRTILRRASVVSLVAIAMIGGLRVYSQMTNPSVADPLQFDASARRKPHIFLVLVDTLRADHLGVYGYPQPTSPNVDALAAKSTIFERAFAPAPWTRPSCGALLTSRYPPEIGLDGMFKALPKRIPILPQYLRKEGYNTAGIVSSVHLSPQFGFDKGWNLLDIGTTYLQWTGTKTAFCRLGVVPWGETYPRYDARELTDRAIGWLDHQLSVESAAPVFMYLHYSDPHAPYRPPEADDRWREFARPEVRRTIAEPPFSPTWGNRELTDEEVEAMVARYDAEIAYFDAQFGRFLGHLKEIGVYDRSLIFLTSDHGEEFREHGGWTHGHSLYNELIHVPIIMKLPRRLGVQSGQRVEATASLVDVVPTIQEILGARWPGNHFRGRSLLRESLGQDDYAVYSKADNPVLRSIVRGDDKLIQTMRDGEVVEERYYSLLEDFSERREGRIPGGIDPDRLDEMRSILSAIDSRTAGDAVEEISVDEETLRELKALGYLD